jgi:hypothetical protein
MTNRRQRLRVQAHGGMIARELPQGRRRALEGRRSRFPVIEFSHCAFDCFRS